MVFKFLRVDTNKDDNGLLPDRGYVVAHIEKYLDVAKKSARFA